MKTVKKSVIAALCLGLALTSTNVYAQKKALQIREQLPAVRSGIIPNQVSNIQLIEERVPGQKGNSGGAAVPVQPTYRLEPSDGNYQSTVLRICLKNTASDVDVGVRGKKGIESITVSFDAELSSQSSLRG